MRSELKKITNHQKLKLPCISQNSSLYQKKQSLIQNSKHIKGVKRNGGYIAMKQEKDTQ